MLVIFLIFLLVIILLIIIQFIIFFIVVIIIIVVIVIYFFFLIVSIVIVVVFVITHVEVNVLRTNLIWTSHVVMLLDLFFFNINLIWVDFCIKGAIMRLIMLNIWVLFLIFFIGCLLVLVIILVLQFNFVLFG